MTALIALRDNLRWSKLHLITDLGAGRGASSADLPSLIADLLDAGVDLVELRDPALAENRELVEKVHEVTFGRRKLLAFGRDLAAASAQQADLLHLGASDGSVPAARKGLHQYALVGRSVHSTAQLEHAVGEADYLYVGPVFGKDVPGLDLVRAAAQKAGDVPWAAVGGVSSENLTQVLEAGAPRVVVSAGVLKASDPVAAVGAIAQTLSEKLGRSAL